MIVKQRRPRRPLKQQKLNVAGVVQLLLSAPQSRNDSTGVESSCKSHILAGFGDKNFNFPTVDALVIAALTRLSQGQVHAQTDELTGPPNTKRRRKAAAIRVNVDEALRSDQQTAGNLPPLPTKAKKKLTLIPLLPEEQLQGVDGTLYAGAEGLRQVFYKGRFDAIVAERFDPLAGAVNWASQNMDQRYQFAIASLADQLAQLRGLYKQALPRVLSVLVAQNQNKSPYELLSAAVGSLDQELRRILYVLRTWTDAFAQLRDGMYLQLQAIVFMMEQAFRLFQTGDLDACSSLDKACSTHPKLATSVFNTGNVFLARFTSTGPSTLPGAKGPNGAHVLNVQHAHKNATALMLTPDCHEFRHDVFADIRGMAEEITLAVVSAIVAEYKAGTLKFTTDKIKFGRSRIATIQAICQLIADTIGEIDADISGGVLLTGPAFVYNLIMLFCALNSPGKSILDADQDDQLLSSESEYFMDNTEQGNPRPRAEEHLPDYIRAYFDAAALDEIGFAKDAAKCRAIADQAAGLPLPQYITWVDGSEGKRSKVKLKIAFADLKAVAPIVARTLIRAKLKSLGGFATCDLINWNANRQAKVDMLVANLLAGNADVPTDKGDFQATYVAAAATMAYWRLAQAGRRIGPSLRMIEENALLMLNTIRQRQAQPAVAPTQCPCPEMVKKDATAQSGAGAGAVAPGAVALTDRNSCPS